MIQIQQAAKIIKESRFDNDIISVDEIAKVIQNYLDDLIAEINNDPECFFRDNYRFWRELDKAALAAEEQQEQVA